MLSQSEYERVTIYHLASIRIQTFFRSYINRKKFLKIMSSIRIIQKFFINKLKEMRELNELIQIKQRERKQYFYNQATKIQKLWRGYWSRKTNFDFNKRKRYINSIIDKMDSMRKFLEPKTKEIQIIRKQIEEKNNHQRMLNRAGMQHHLVGTKANPGVYCPPNEKKTLKEIYLKDNPKLKKCLKQIGKNPKQVQLYPPKIVPKKEDLKKYAQGPFLPRYKLDQAKKVSTYCSLRCQTNYKETLDFNRELKRHSLAMHMDRSPPKPKKVSMIVQPIRNIYC
ncbi:hypothetical protein BC833DRAFT_617218 [Globomyces pollinis-pini]|nr:hypothetical protein BC833DRAFT_617218 [Globomyces pollinis-pini]